MRSLQVLLTILNGQKLSPGYLTPAGSGTALETVNALMAQFSYYVLLQNPLPGMTNRTEGVNILLCPAWVARYAGQDAIFLSDVEGRLDTSHGTQQPAYLFTTPV